MKKKIYLGFPLILLVSINLACGLSGKSTPTPLPTATATFTPPPPTETLPPKPSGTIIYQTDQYGNGELLSIDLRTGKTLRLTNNSANDVTPAYISATRQIGFVSDRQDGWNLYTMDKNGMNPTAITDRKGMMAADPRWSPDGKTIAVSLVESCPSTAKVCNYDIYVMNADGTGLTNLTNTPASEWVPDWSPDGQKIAFASDRDGDSEIYVMNKDGSGLVQLTNNSNFDGYPRWSPDGSKLAFTSDRDGGNWHIYLMNPDGSDPVLVTSNTNGNFASSWSPDGKWLVYISYMDGDNEILIIDIHGQNQQRLTNNTYNDTAPIWIP